MSTTTSAPRFHFALPAWGQRYIDVLLSVGLPSQLSPQNLPRFPWRSTSVYEIYTTRQDQERIEASAVFRQLSGIIETRFVDIGDLLAQPSWRDDQRKWPVLRRCHQQMVSSADDHDAAVFFLCPDQIWSDGSLTNAGTRIADGCSAVLCPGPRAAEESMVPAVRARFLSPDGCALTVPARELVRLGFEHIHPEMRRWFWDAEDYVGCPTYVFFNVPGEGVLASCYILHPVVINAERRHAPLRRIFDQDYLLAACPTLDRIHVARDSDDVVHFEVSPAADNCSRAPTCPRGERIASMHVRAEFEYNAHHRAFATHPVQLHCGAITAAAWQKPTAQARRITESVQWHLSLPDWVLLFWEPRALIRRIEGRWQLRSDPMSRQDRTLRELARALVDRRDAARAWLRERAAEHARTRAQARLEAFTPTEVESPDLQEAAAALARGDHQLALANYLASARARPDDAAAWRGVSRTLLAAGELTRATEVIDRAIALDPRAADAHSVRALIHRQLGDMDGELAALSQAVTCAPDDGPLWDTLLGALERGCDAESVIEFADTNRDVIPRTVPLGLRLSRLHASLGQLDTARALLDELRARHPAATEVSSARALLALQTGRHDDAVAALEEAIATAPGDPELWRTLVAVIENLKGPAAAADYLAHRERAPSLDIELGVHAARLYASAGRREDAARQLQQVVCPADADPESASELLESDPQRRDALARALDHAVRLEPDDARHWHTVLTHLEDLWGPRTTAAFIDRHHARVPADPVLDLRIARLVSAMGQIGPGALRALRRVAAPNLGDAAAEAALAGILEALDHGIADEPPEEPAPDSQSGGS